MTKKNTEKRPAYIIKVHRDWKYEGKDGSGYWSTACKGGLAYTERGMWRAINKRLKKMQFGYQTNYFSLDKQPIKEPK